MERAIQFHVKKKKNGVLLNMLYYEQHQQDTYTHFETHLIWREG